MGTSSFDLNQLIRRPSTWICLLALGLSLATVKNTGAWDDPESVAAQASGTLRYLAPGFAAAVAWEAAQFRKLTSHSSVNLWKQSVRGVLLGSLLFPICYVLALVVLGSGMELLSLDLAWKLSLYFLVVGLCWGVIATALGLLVGPLAASSLSALLAFGWHTASRFAPPGPVRALTGDFLACCSTEFELDRRSVLVAGLGILGLCALVISVALFLSGDIRLGLLALAVGFAVLVTGYALATTLDDLGLRPRRLVFSECMADICSWVREK